MHALCLFDDAPTGAPAVERASSLIREALNSADASEDEGGYLGCTRCRI